eukprot:m.12244 g.12244  ORF g.12244 m.12244 type:complete len:653 (+) comp5814_c0_seq1:24-1982(+)
MWRRVVASGQRLTHTLSTVPTTQGVVFSTQVLPLYLRTIASFTRPSSTGQASQTRHMATSSSDMDTSAPPARTTSDGFVPVTEGAVTILFPDDDQVFYNPVQVFNRDLSTLVISTWQESYLRRRGEKADGRLKRRLIEERVTAAKQQATGMASDSDATSSTGERGSETGAAAVDTKAIAESVESELAQLGTEMHAKYQQLLPHITDCRGPQHAGFDPAKHGITILEGLAASGLRSLRYYKEIPNVKNITCNDFSPEAVESIKRNVEFNEMNPETQVKPNFGDASMVMYNHKHRDQQYDVIDLDPYGTAAPFLDAAVQAVKSGGLLCITCTDMAVLCGSHLDACFAKYGSMPVKSHHCHEMGVRILLALVSRLATRYGRYIKPLMSCSIDFYCRVFVEVYDGAAQGKLAASQTMNVHQCTGCPTFHCAPVGRVQATPKGGKKFLAGQAPPLAQHCDQCGRIYHVGGPYWGDRLHDKAFITSALDQLKKERQFPFNTTERINGMLMMCREELETPLYYTVASMSNTLHCTSPPHDMIKSAIVNAGYQVSATHCHKNGIKTDAPPSLLWDIFREFVKENPVTDKVMASDSPASAILQKEMQHEIDFTLNDAIKPQSRLQGITRFPAKPAFWGPKARAGKRKPDAAKQSKKAKSKE